MLLKQIEYYLAVVETGSFSEAAEKCFISQSAVSQQIKALERELGVTLLKRHNRSFSMTPAGELFYRKCTVLKNDLDSIIRDTMRIGKGSTMTLSIGYLRCYGGYEFQNAVAAFSEQHPDADIKVITGDHEELYEALRDGKLDIVLNDQRRAFSQDYVNNDLIDCKCYIEISSRHPLSKLPSVDIEDLKNTPCILVTGKEQQKNEETFYRDILGFRGGFIHADNLQEARLLVISQKAVLPVEYHGDITFIDSSISLVPLFKNSAQMTRRYCAFWRRENRNPCIDEFYRQLKEQF